MDMRMSCNSRSACLEVWIYWLVLICTCLGASTMISRNRPAMWVFRSHWRKLSSRWMQAQDGQIDIKSLVGVDLDPQAIKRGLKRMCSRGLTQKISSDVPYLRLFHGDISCTAASNPGLQTLHLMQPAKLQTFCWLSWSEVKDIYCVSSLQATPWRPAIIATQFGLTSFLSWSDCFPYFLVSCQRGLISEEVILFIGNRYGFSTTRGCFNPRTFQSSPKACLQCRGMGRDGWGRHSYISGSYRASGPSSLGSFALLPLRSPAA